MDYVAEISNLLDMPPAEKRQVMRELIAHHQDLAQELTDTGLTRAEAEADAARRMGEPNTVASRLSAVHGRASWRSALLTAVPVIGGVALALDSGHAFTYGSPGSGILLICRRLFGVWGPSLGSVILAGIFLAPSIRELMRGRRPVWLATWLAAGIALAGASLLSAVHRFYAFSPANALVAIGIACVPALLASWHSPTWRRRALSMALALVFLSLSHPSARSMDSVWYLSSSMLLPMALWVILATRVFALGPLGHPAQASLFLFILLCEGPFLPSPASVFAPMWPVIDGATLYCYARAPRWTGKVALLAVGALARAVAVMTVPPPHVRYVDSLILSFAFLALLLLILPTWLQRRTHEDAAGPGCTLVGA